LSQRSVASSAQHRQEAEVVAAEERERAVVRLAMVELAAARAKVEAAVAADAARAAAAELEALHASSIDNSVSADDDRDNELKLVREAAREQAAQWAAVHPQGTVVAAQTGVDAPAVLRAGARMAVVPLTAAVAQTGADTLVVGLMEIAHVRARLDAADTSAPPTAAVGLTEIVAFIGGAALPPRIGIMVTM
jgi:hypothetical protein